MPPKKVPPKTIPSKKVPPKTIPSKKVPPKRRVVCGRCQGIGSKDIQFDRICGKCVGRGYIWITGPPDMYGLNHARVSIPCKECGGHGRTMIYKKAPCDFCFGNKFVYI